MIYAGIVLAYLFAAVVLFGSYNWVSKKERQWERKENAWLAERSQLLDRLMFIVDRPWQAPPEPPRFEDDEADLTVMFPGDIEELIP